MYPRQEQRVSVPVQHAPVQPQQEQTIHRAASLASIPSEKLGKGAGYASPMPPVDHMGRPIDQRTWRERQSLVKEGIKADAALTEEQKIRRDSQMAKLTASQAGTASAAPRLSTQQELPEPQVSREEPRHEVFRTPPQSPQRQPQTPSAVPAFPPGTPGNRETPSAPPQLRYQLYEPTGPAMSPVRASFLPSSPYGGYASPGPQNNRDSYDGLQVPRVTSIADDIYGGLTTGLSDRDISKLNQTQRR